MARDVADLLDALDLERVEANIFWGRVPDTGRKRVFGGLVVAQALAAATNTVDDDRPPHSLHAYFILPGDPALPIVYQVERVRDGRSFATRRCRKTCCRRKRSPSDIRGASQGR
jgi:acyl-CoA thioesterase-2